MKFWTSRFQNGLRRLKSHVNSLWRGLIPRRPDDAAEPGDLDRLWRAECDETDATLVAVIPLENESLWAVPTPCPMFDAKGGNRTFAASAKWSCVAGESRHSISHRSRFFSAMLTAAVRPE
jgi:hypothetical protein